MVGTRKKEQANKKEHSMQGLCSPCTAYRSTTIIITLFNNNKLHPFSLVKKQIPRPNTSIIRRLSRSPIRAANILPQNSVINGLDMIIIK